MCCCPFPHPPPPLPLSGWLFKNKDPINEAMVGLMLAGSNPLVVYLFTEKDTGGKKKGGSMATISAGHRVSSAGVENGAGQRLWQTS